MHIRYAAYRAKRGGMGAWFFATTKVCWIIEADGKVSVPASQEERRSLAQVLSLAYHPTVSDY
eukprot:2406581-Amphidinium_carterae.1